MSYSMAVRGKREHGLDEALCGAEGLSARTVGNLLRT
jgi:hypothetical protein